MAHVIVIGAGAIGSHVLPHVARMKGVSAVTVIDRDRYDGTNLASQAISTRDIGRSKAAVQARRLKAVNRSLRTRAVCEPVEDLPLGRLRADVILACVDSRRARLTINQAAWRLGVPWIDAGIEAAGLLARIQVYVPSPDSACLECAWDGRDYDLVEQDYPCAGRPGGHPTHAPSALGALAAALQAIECQKLLEHATDQLLMGRNLLLDTRHHRHYVTSFHRNPACRMPDHATWHLTPYAAQPHTVLVEELAALGSMLVGSEHGVRMRVAGRPFAATLTCPSCGRRSPAGHVHRPARQPLPLCTRCHRELGPTGFDLRDEVDTAALSPEVLRRPLASLGLRCGDVVTLATGAVEMHLEIGADPCQTRF
jgi:adenylyltransferase/sulfurtransferase